MKNAYIWPQIEKNMFSHVGVDFWIDHQKSQNAGNASCHHYHEVFELYYLYEGNRSYYIEGKTYRIESGSFVLIRPGEIHSTGLADPMGYDRYLLHFSLDYLENLERISGLPLISSSFSEGVYVIPVDFSMLTFVESLLRTMLEEFEAQKEGYKQFLAAATIQILLLLERYKSCNEICEQRDSDNIYRIVTESVTYINQHYCESLSLKDMADMFYISSCYFSHAFKKITGISFVKYVNGIRIKEAQRLLRNSKLAVSEVAEAVGYANITHFGRVFKEITRMTPSEYKVKINNKNT